METLEELDTVIIGGGVVGMAVALTLAQQGREVVLLEAESTFGTHTSSRNSEVIHAGIYYPSGSLKAKLCVKGRDRLYEYCAERGIPHRRIGKLIVAINEQQVDALEGIRKQAVLNGVDNLEWLQQSQIRDLEPNIVAEAGLFSPSTGIIDSHEFMASLRREAHEAGALTVPSSPVTAGRVSDRGIEISVGGQEPATFHCRSLVNAAGLHAPQVARTIAGVPPELIPEAFFAKGHYFTLSGRSPFRHLVYPIPEAGGLGIHVTLDMSGAARFGPDVSWLSTIDYGFDESRAKAFYAAIRTYFPTLAEGDLVPGYTGIRPKIVPQGSPAADFVVQGPEVHGLPLVNLFGIESPGLTAALAIAELVQTSLGD